MVGMMPATSTLFEPTYRYFDLGFAKADTSAEEAGQWLIYVRASTPQLDFERERVLPQALKDAASYFLENGKVTFEHIDQSNRHDASILIGEPLAVKFTPEGDTLVQARLYPYQPQAQHVWNILRSGGKLKASIGGSCVKRPAGDGATEIPQLWWNHLAITSWPVNNDTIVSLQPFEEFVKALATTAAAPLVMQDLHGAMHGGTPALLGRWQALTDLLQQQHPTLTEEQAKQVALAWMIRRGETRHAYTSAQWSPMA